MKTNLLKYFILVSFGIITSSFLKGQAGFTSFSKELPPIQRGSDRFVDFLLKNSSKEDISLLRSSMEYDVKVRYSKNIIPAGDEAIVRVQINPTKKGKFKREIKVFVSYQNEPITLTISGKVEEIPEDLDLECPRFDAPNQMVLRPSLVSGFDAETKQMVKKTRLKIIALDGSFEKTISPDASGFYKPTLEVGRYQFVMDGEGYGSATLYEYIAAKGNEIKMALVKLPEKENVKKDEMVKNQDTLLTIPKPEEEKVVVKPVENPQKNEQKSEVKKELERMADPRQKIELSRDLYKPNHILFLIDISSSMADRDKLPLLKLSMMKLIESLRDIDKITIITYADGTDILAEAVSGDKKEALRKGIEALNAFGSTQGKKAIELAYQKIENHYIEGGNNQIYLATDGDFKLGKTDQDMYQFLENKAGQNQNLSVIGFGRREKSLEKMKKISKAGNGSFMHITLKSDYEQILKEEVMKQSIKK